MKNFNLYWKQGKELWKNKIYTQKNRLIAHRVLLFFLFITMIATIVPFSPHMPGPGLDPSWIFALNQAVAQALAFGKDIIFTFGPYASLLSESYHPATDHLMIIGSIYLALSYAICAVILMRKVRWYWIIALCAVITGFTLVREAIFLSIPLCIGITVSKIKTPEYQKYFASKWIFIYGALLFAPLGLLAIIKGNLFMISVGVIFLSAVFLIKNDHKILACIAVASPLASLILFWMISGQSLTNLLPYFVHSIPIISGYTESMSFRGNSVETFLYLATATCFILVIINQSKILRSTRIFLLCLYTLFLFLAFKSGFVRHDAHSMIAGTAILIGALSLPSVIKHRNAIVIILLAFATWYFIDTHEIKTTFHDFTQNIGATYSSAWNGIHQRLRYEDRLEQEFQEALQNMRTQKPLPVMPGTSDIYSFNQSYLIASGNTWSPRPIFQSYSAYTPKLAEINKKHLIGSDAPDTIFFKVEPIDGRVPSIEDGASWPVLFSHYQPIKTAGDYLILARKKNVTGAAEPIALTTETHTFGEQVLLPNSSKPLFAKIFIEPTVVGRLTGILYKPSQIKITFELINGGKKSYRISASMAESGFLISPLVENTPEFGFLYDRNSFLDRKLVRSITINTEKELFWHENYKIIIEEIPSPEPMNMSAIYKYDTIDKTLSNMQTASGQCAGHIDLIDDIQPSQSGTLSVSKTVSISGWLALSVEKAIVPDKVYVVFTDSMGNREFLATNPVDRPDVGVHFKNEKLTKTGYTIVGDISKLHGNYTLGIAHKTNSNMNICPGFNVPLLIHN